MPVVLIANHVCQQMIDFALAEDAGDLGDISAQSTYAGCLFHQYWLVKEESNEVE